MIKDINIALAAPNDFEAVGTLTWELLFELSPEWTSQHPKSEFISTSIQLLSPGDYFWAFVAKFNDEVIATLNLNQCASIYSGGFFGEITEFYIKPEHRSKGIGKALINSAKHFAAERGWPVLEVGAPPPETWQRTIDFYLENGFSHIGPRLETNLKTL